MSTFLLLLIGVLFLALLWFPARRERKRMRDDRIQDGWGNGEDMFL